MESKRQVFCAWTAVRPMLNAVRLKLVLAKMKEMRMVMLQDRDRQN